MVLYFEAGQARCGDNDQIPRYDSWDIGNQAGIAIQPGPSEITQRNKGAMWLCFTIRNRTYVQCGAPKIAKLVYNSNN